MDKALALINTFATGDTETAAQLLDENYIQHNLAYGTGEDAFLASVEGLAAADAETTVENIRAFEDGDYVFLQNVYNFAGAGEQVAFDIFRFDEDGEIAEHWDNLAALATDPNPSGHTQIDGTTEVTDLDQTEANRTPGGELPLRCDAGQQPRQDRRLLRRGHLYPAQHRHRRRRLRPERGSGRPGQEGIQMIYDETHMVLAQGNFVLAVSEGTYGGEPTSYYDLWRVENDKITEHWDVMETIADQSTWQNDNGKF